MNKKIVLGIVIGVIAVALVAVVLVLTLGNGGIKESNVYKQGDIVKIPIEVTKNPGMIIAKTIVNFDSSVLEYIECENGLFTDNTVSAVDGKATCLLMADFTKTAEDITKTGTAATLEFKVKEGAKAGEYAISIDEKNSEYANINEKFVTPNVSVVEKITIK